MDPNRHRQFIYIYIYIFIYYRQYTTLLNKVIQLCNCYVCFYIDRGMIKFGWKLKIRILTLGLMKWAGIYFSTDLEFIELQCFDYLPLFCSSELATHFVYLVLINWGESEIAGPQLLELTEDLIVTVFLLTVGSKVGTLTLSNKHPSVK